MIIVITGATKGIGRAIAEKFAESGHIIVACARNKNDLTEMEIAFKQQFQIAILYTKAVDLSTKEGAIEFGCWLIDEKLIPDVLVNNAGSFLPGSIYNEDHGTLEKMMEVNLYSAYHLTRTVLPVMMENKSGHIFNMCSIASLQAYTNGGAYSISKFALLGFSKNLREELKPHGIKVTAVSPGAVMSASWEGSDIDPKRIMEAKDIANMVFASANLSPMAVVEDIVMRPQLGDLE